MAEDRGPPDATEVIRILPAIRTRGIVGPFRIFRIPLIIGRGIQVGLGENDTDFFAAGIQCLALQQSRP